MYYQQLGQNKRIFVRVGDIRPLLQVQLIKESDGTYEDISSGIGHINIKKKDGTSFSSGSSLDVSTDGATGIAYYDLSNDPINTVGSYDVVWKIDLNGTGKWLSIPESPLSFELVVS